MSQATPSEVPGTAQRPNEFNLVWLDMEMTGLDPDNDRIIEVAVVVTDPDLNIIAEGPVFAIHQSDETLEGIDDLVDDVIARGSQVFIAGEGVRGAIALPSKKGHPAIEPMLQIQSFYRAANALSLARGFDPDVPPHLAKVTETV